MIKNLPAICNAGDPGLIPGSGRSPGEEKDSSLLPRDGEGLCNPL